MFFRRSNKKSHFSDEELIRQYQATRDVAYVAELYQRYTHLVYGTCLKYLKDEEDSKDAAMQVFEKLIQVLKSQEVTKFEYWLHVLTKNYCLMELRSRKTKQEKLQSENIPGLMDTITDPGLPGETLKTEEQLSKLEDGLNCIPTEQRICIELFYLQKKCYQEIAETTGYDLNKVKSYIQNGKRNLKIYLEKHYDRS